MIEFRLSDFHHNYTLENFKKEFFDRVEILHQKSVFNEGLDHVMLWLENFIKNPANANRVSYVFKGQYYPFYRSQQELDYVINDIKELTGDAFWKRVTRGGGSVHIKQFNKDCPFVQNLKKDFFKNFKDAPDPYFVVSYNLSERAYDPHTDPLDVFAIQINGSKSWHFPIDDNDQLRKIDSGYIDYDPQDENIRYRKLKMERGDTMYIPFQVIHDVHYIQPEVSAHLVYGVPRKSHFMLDLYIKRIIAERTAVSHGRRDMIDYEGVKKEIEIFLKIFKEMSEIDPDVLTQGFLDHYEKENMTKMLK